MKSARERFDAKVLRTETCWLWQASLSGGGYGTFCIGNGVLRPAHRVSWEFEHGPIQDGLWVLHRCDVRACVRPDHLFLGTPADNTHDMHHKGRGGKGCPPGMGSGMAKLTDDQVREIRARYAAGGVTCAQLAPDYGIAGITVSKIVQRATWKHLPDENPERLFLRRVGERATHVLLKESDVREIRRAYSDGGVTLLNLAGRFGVAITTVSAIVLRKTWRHI